MHKVCIVFFSFMIISYASVLSQTDVPDEMLITFSINDILEIRPSILKPNTRSNTQFPFSNPRNTFPQKNGDTDLLTRTRPLSVMLPFLASIRASEFGTITVIDEELTSDIETGLLQQGKVQGIYVRSSKDNSSLIVAFTVIFSNKGGSEDNLRLFGELRLGLLESHIAVIGGSGRYCGANGVAVIKPIDLTDGNLKRELMFTLYVK